MSGINWNSAPNYAGVNAFSGSPVFGLANGKPDFGFNMPMCAPMPGPGCGVNFKPECNESVAHVLRGLTAAVNMLLDDGRFGCRPNDCSPKQDSWCFPQMDYVPLSLPQDCWQPNRTGRRRATGNSIKVP